MTYLELIEAVRENVTDGRFISVNTLWSDGKFGGPSFTVTIYDPVLSPNSTKHPTAQGVFDAWRAKWNCHDVDGAVHEMELPEEATQ